jgi:ATP-binding cassette subfamily C protein
LTEIYTRDSSKQAVGLGVSRNNLAETSRRNAEALVAMGMTRRLASRWRETNRRFIATQQKASDVASGFASTSKVLRMVLQSAVLAVGAYLVINQQATAGIIIAGSILSARALAPVDLAIANWKGFVAARQSWQALNQLLTLFPVQTERMALEPPEKSLSVDHAAVAPPGIQRLAASNIKFVLNAGDGLGIIGPSGSGKSSLARLLVGLWQPARGKICLDGASLDQWSPDALGQHIGYLPQDVELLTGTIAENIARFQRNPSPDAIIAAAKAAAVHELIVGMPEGYTTQIGEQGTALSAGQAQRIALARALYGNPFLVVLDEPNSNLDGEGDEALTHAILGIKERKGIVIVVAHRPSAIRGVNLILAMNQGQQVAFGPKDEVLAKVLRRPSPLKVAHEIGSATA